MRVHDDRLIGEVVIAKRRRTAARRRRHVQRQDELTHFAGVADEPRRPHVGCRRLRRFGVGGDPDPRLALGERDEPFALDDGLDLGEPLPVVRQDRLADELFLFEGADDVAIVGGLQAARLGDRGREALHLALDLGKRLARHRRERFGLPRDADLFERERIEIDGQPKIRPCLGQHLLADELLVLAELLLERRERLAPAVDLEVVEQLLQALHEDRAVGQVALHLRPGRRQEVRVRLPRRASAASPAAVTGS